MLLHDHANGFLVVNMLPKLHTNDLFGWVSSPCKTSLVLILMVKHFFYGVETIFEIFSSKYDCVIYNVNIIITWLQI